MWVLLLFVMTYQSVGGPTLVVPLKKPCEGQRCEQAEGYNPLYTTLKTCEQERDRITTEMKRAYPGEEDYTLECQKVEKPTI